MEQRQRGEACKESGAGEVSNNSLVRVRVKVRERMGAGLVRLSESEWVLRDLGLGKLVFILGFFFFF